MPSRFPPVVFYSPKEIGGLVSGDALTRHVVTLQYMFAILVDLTPYIFLLSCTLHLSFWLF
jgi:hypothetical protein